MPGLLAKDKCNVADTKTRGVSCPPSPILNGLRLVGWSLILTLAGLALLAIAGEVYFRQTTPFLGNHLPEHFVPNVGVVGKPNVEVRYTNGLDYWTVSQTNSLGFLDRELISPERAAASCHVAMIGDSFVEAREVPIADKFHVRLETLAARELPHLDVTTSAFGRSGTGQINQLPYYDEYARHLHPKLLVLVAVFNDFMDNSVISMALSRGFQPERMPYVTAARDEDGKIELRPPHPDYMTFRLARGLSLSESAARTLKDSWGNSWEKVRGRSSFANWLHHKTRIVFKAKIAADRVARVELLSLPSGGLSLDEKERSFLLGMRGKKMRVMRVLWAESSPFWQNALDVSAFGLDQFKARADRDGVALIILATETMRAPGSGGGRAIDWMKAMAEARGIPVIDLYDYILRRGGRVEDTHWTHDRHWNPTGHRWTAEALLEYLKQHPTVCT